MLAMFNKHYDPIQQTELTGPPAVRQVPRTPRGVWGGRGSNKHTHLGSSRTFVSKVGLGWVQRVQIPSEEVRLEPYRDRNLKLTTQSGDGDGNEAESLLRIGPRCSRP